MPSEELKENTLNCFVIYCEWINKESKNTKVKSDV